MNDAGRIGFVIRGDYDSTSTYDFLDIVFYSGSSYVAKKLTTGNEPNRDNEFWHIFAEKADEGDYVLKSDYATTEKAGIVKPDGTTITVDADGTISGSNQTVVDAELSSESENPVQNKVVNSALLGKISEDKIANTASVTEAGFVADARQLNKTVEGSYAAGVAEEISGINANLANTSIPKYLIFGCSGTLLANTNLSFDLTNLRTWYSKDDLSGRFGLVFAKNNSINESPYLDSGIARSKTNIDLTKYKAMVIKGCIFGNAEMTCRGYFSLGTVQDPKPHEAYDFSSWNLIAESNGTQKSFEAYIDVSSAGSERMNFAVFHGEESLYNTAHLLVSEILLVGV